MEVRVLQWSQANTILSLLLHVVSITQFWMIIKLLILLELEIALQLPLQSNIQNLAGAKNKIMLKTIGRQWFLETVQLFFASQKKERCPQCQKDLKLTNSWTNTEYYDRTNHIHHEDIYIIYYSSFIWTSFLWMVFSTEDIFSFRRARISLSYSAFEKWFTVDAFSFYLPRLCLSEYFSSFLAFSSFTYSSSLIFLNSNNKTSMQWGAAEASFWHSSDVKDIPNFERTFAKIMKVAYCLKFSSFAFSIWPN